MLPKVKSNPESPMFGVQQMFYTVDENFTVSSFTGIGDYNGKTIYCKDGELHRTDGPAIEDRWYYHGIQLPSIIFSDSNALVVFFIKWPERRARIAGLVREVVGENAFRAIVAALTLTEK